MLNIKTKTALLTLLFTFCFGIASQAQLHYPTAFRDDIAPRLTLIGADARNAIILIHGWNPPDPFLAGRVAENKYVEEPTWSSLRNALFEKLAGGEWKVILYHWEQDAATGFADFSPIKGAVVQDAVRNATEAANRAVLHGKFLADTLNQQAPNLASMPESDRIFRLDHYFADDIETMGTDVIFNWRSNIDVGGQKTDYGTGVACYNGHSGPINFIADTVIATTPPGVF